MKRNTITIIELIIVICVIVVVVMVWSYKRAESETASTSSIPAAAPDSKSFHGETLSIIYQYYVISLSAQKNKEYIANHRIAINMTVDWLNGKVPSSILPIPQDIEKVYVHEERDSIGIIFTNGEHLYEFLSPDAGYYIPKDEVFYSK